MNEARSEYAMQDLSQIQALEHARDMMTEHLAEQSLQSLKNLLDPAAVYSPLRHAVHENNKTYGNPAAIDNLFTLDAIGFDTDQILHEYRKEPEATDRVSSTANVALGSATISLYRGQYETHYIRSGGDGQEYLQQLEIAVQNRIAQSPAHVALKEALDSRTDPDVVQTEPFNYGDDPVGTLLFMHHIGLSRDMERQASQRIAEGVTEASVEQTLRSDLNYGVHQETTGNITTYHWLSQNRAVTKTLHVDTVTKKASFSARKSAPLAYLEKANQSEARSVPFIDSECARVMAEYLEHAGLVFSPDLQERMIMLGGSDRYGSVYTYMSREVAKWVNNPDRVHVSNLFHAKETEQGPVAIAQRAITTGLGIAREPASAESEALVRQRLQEAGVIPETSEAAATLLTLARDVLNRITYESDLPVTTENISMTDGACFDVVGYYLGAAERIYEGYPDSLSIKSVNDVKLMKKTFGSHTYLTLSPQQFNGITIPKGSLMKRENARWAMLRLTPFAFDNPKDQLAFGSEISKALENESRAIERIGDISLASLVKIDK